MWIFRAIFRLIITVFICVPSYLKFICPWWRRANLYIYQQPLAPPLSSHIFNICAKYWTCVHSLLCNGPDKPNPDLWTDAHKDAHIPSIHVTAMLLPASRPNNYNQVLLNIHTQDSDKNDNHDQGDADRYYITTIAYVGMI